MMVSVAARSYLGSGSHGSVAWASNNRDRFCQSMVLHECARPRWLGNAGLQYLTYREVAAGTATLICIAGEERCFMPVVTRSCRTGVWLLNMVETLKFNRTLIMTRTSSKKRCEKQMIGKAIGQNIDKKKSQF